MSGYSSVVCVSSDKSCAWKYISSFQEGLYHVKYFAHLKKKAQCELWVKFYLGYGREFEWTLGVSDGQGGLACCNSWGHKDLDMTERLNWLNWTEYENYSLGDSTSDSSGKLFQRGRGKRQCVCDFAKGGICAIKHTFSVESFC